MNILKKICKIIENEFSHNNIFEIKSMNNVYSFLPSLEKILLLKKVSKKNYDEIPDFSDAEREILLTSLTILSVQIISDGFDNILNIGSASTEAFPHTDYLEVCERINEILRQIKSQQGCQFIK